MPGMLILIQMIICVLKMNLPVYTSSSKYPGFGNRYTSPTITVLRYYSIKDYRVIKIL